MPFLLVFFQLEVSCLAVYPIGCATKEIRTGNGFTEFSCLQRPDLGPPPRHGRFDLHRCSSTRSGQSSLIHYGIRTRNWSTESCIRYRVSHCRPLRAWPFRPAVVSLLERKKKGKRKKLFCHMAVLSEAESWSAVGIGLSATLVRRRGTLVVGCCPSFSPSQSRRLVICPSFLRLQLILVAQKKRTAKRREWNW